MPQPFKAAPTGGYTFLGFGAKNPPNFPQNQPVPDEGRTPEMHLGLNTIPSENQGKDAQEDTKWCGGCVELCFDWRFVFCLFVLFIYFFTFLAFFSFYFYLADGVDGLCNFTFTYF